MQKIFLLIMGSLIFNCTVFAQKAVQMKWITGTWKINAANGVIMEQWQLVNDSTFKGTSVFIKNETDTIPQESIELVYRNGEWYYIPTVASQNNGQPISFKVIFLKGTEFISENPAHDFPQRIAYRQIKNQLFASIEGWKDGRYRKQNFNFD